MFQHDIFQNAHDDKRIQTPRLSDIPELDGPVALDTETNDPMLSRGYGAGFPFKGIGHVAGIAISARNWQGYLPVGHEDPTDNLDIAEVKDWLLSHVLTPGRKLVFHNSQYDVGWLERFGIDIKDSVEIHDTALMAPLIDENKRRYGLDILAKEYLGDVKDETLLKQVAADRGIKGNLKSEMWKLPGGLVSRYATKDAELTLRLFDELSKEMDAQKLWGIYEIERKLVPVLIAMRFRGVRVDLERAMDVRDRFEIERDEAINEIERQTGIHLQAGDYAKRQDLHTNASLGKVMDAIGIEPPKTEKSGEPSVRSEWLNKQDHPVCQLIARAKKFDKAINTFLDGYIIERAVSGRIYGEFKQLKSDDGGTVSGRLSSARPNLQNLPIRDPDVGPWIRDCFLPEEGENWASIDFSAQEPRLTVHFAAKARLPGAENAVQRFRENPYIDYHDMVAEITGLARKSAKTINLGLAYGMGGAELCRRVGHPTRFIERDGRSIEVAGEEGQRVLDTYRQNLPFVSALSDMTKRVAGQRGWLRTLLGRRIHFKKGPRGHEGTHKSLNRLIQGSAGDQMKKALIDLYEAGFVPLVTVHDEVAISYKSQDELDRASQIVTDAVDLLVPMVVDCDTGATWGEAADESGALLQEKGLTHSGNNGTLSNTQHEKEMTHGTDTDRMLADLETT